jgi:hypothetical protein
MWLLLTWNRRRTSRQWWSGRWRVGEQAEKTGSGLLGKSRRCCGSLFLVLAVVFVFLAVGGSSRKEISTRWIMTSHFKLFLC